MKDLLNALKVLESYRLLNSSPRLTKIAEEFQAAVEQNNGKKRPRVTRAMVKEIKDFMKTHPEFNQKQVAEVFGIHFSSVSRIVTGRTKGI